MRPAGFLAPLTALVAAEPANAHAFLGGADYYSQFLAGAGVIFQDPAFLLPTLSLGILLSLWRLDGLPRVWPLFVIGLIAGVFLATFVGPVVSIVLTALGIVTAALAALLPRHVQAETAGLAILTGLLLAAASLEGHGLFEESVFIHLGIFFAANLALAAPAALVRIAIEQHDAPWVRIGARVVASWLGAILVLMFAFAVSNS